MLVLGITRNININIDIDIDIDIDMQPPTEKKEKLLLPPNLFLCNLHILAWWMTPQAPGVTGILRFYSRSSTTHRSGDA